MTNHYSHADLFDYLDGKGNLAAVDEHVQHCSVCAKRLRDQQQFTNLIADPAVWEMVSLSDGAEELQATLASERAQREKERFESDSTLQELRQHFEPEEWAGVLSDRLEARTEEMVRRLIDAAIEEFDRRPQTALHILDAADRVASTLGGRYAVPDYRSEILKNRANALRMLGKYEEGLAAVSDALSLAEQFPTSSFDLAEITYTRGTLLFKMGEFAAAAATAADAALRFAMHHDVKRICHSRMLEAAALTEQGYLHEALKAYEAILPHMDRFGDRPMVAGLRMNIGVCHLRLGELQQAYNWVIQAKHEFWTLGMTAEDIRSDWAIAKISLFATAQLCTPEACRKLAGWQAPKARRHRFRLQRRFAPR